METRQKSKLIEARRGVFLLGVMIMFIFFIGGIDATLDDGLNAYWSFETSSGTDVGTGVNNVSYTGAGANSSSVAGKIGYALSCNGTDYAENSTALDIPTGDESRTINFWTAVPADPHDMGLLSYGSGATRQMWLTHLVSANLTHSIYGTDIFVNEGLPIAWEMITVRYATGSNNIEFFVNGTNTINGSTGSSLLTTDEVLRFCEYAHTTGYVLVGLIDEIGIWNRSLTSTEITQLYNDGEGVTFPIILNAPANMTNTTVISNTFNATVVVLGTVANVSLYLNGTLNDTNTSGYDGTYLFTKSLAYGAHNWTMGVCDTNGACSNATARQLNVLPIIVDVNTFNSTTYETALETFSVDTTSSVTITAATLVYDGTEYTTTQDGDSFSRTLVIPEVDSQENRELYWNFTYAGGYLASNVSNQTVNSLVFTLCNTTYATKFINFTFQDESDSSSINATIPSSNFTYYLGDGTITKEYLLVNNTANYDYALCTNVNRTFYVDTYIQYASTGYPQRVYDPNILTLTNTTTNKILYLLGTDNGIYVTFQIVNSADQVLEGVTMIANRSISGTSTTVGQGTSGADGSVTLWLNPDYIHTLLFEATGYDDYTTSFAPTQSSYTITMGGAANPDTDYVKGINITISPTNLTLDNDTEYTFQFIIDSDYWDIDSFGFELVNSSGDELASTSSSSNGGTVNYVLNTTSNIEIRMNYWYVINDSYTNYTRMWIVRDSSGTSWSISHFFTRLNTYVGQEILGIDNFGLALISFMIIFVATGIASYSFGLRSPVTIMAFVMTLVIFLDIGINWLPRYNDIPLITILTGLACVAFFIKEELR